MKIDFYKPLDVSGMSDEQAIAHTAEEFRKLQKVFMGLNKEVEFLKQKVQQLEQS